MSAPGLVRWLSILGLVLGSGTVRAADLIFGDDFEGNCALPLVLTVGTTLVNGSLLPARTVSFRDAACKPREAVMVDQRAGGTGFLRRYTYRIGPSDRVCTGIPSNGNAIQGMGYVTNHLGNGPTWGNWTVSTPGTTTVVLEGRHHAILEYAMPTYSLGVDTIPTTVQWFFSNARSHPLFAVAQDARAYPAGNLGADSRSPYGSMNFPGDLTDLPIAGVSWGDTFKFVSLVAGTTGESTLLENSSGWRYDEPNAIPYTMAWTSSVDAEQGTVSTLPILLQDQGSDPRTYPGTGFGKNQQDLNGPFPVGDDWAYQMMNYPDVPAGGTTDKKIAWGTNFGFLGGFDDWCGVGCGYDLRDYSQHHDSTTPYTGSRENGLLLAYSTLVVLGRHGGGYRDGATGQVVQQMENHQLATLSATVGTVRTQGPRGVGPAAGAVVTYSPAGYNPVYATWDVDAAGSAADLTLTAAPGQPVGKPIFVVHGYTASGLPSAVTIDGLPAVADSDYLATRDAAAQRLWVTVPRTVTTTVRLAIVP